MALLAAKKSTLHEPSKVSHLAGLRDNTIEVCVEEM
jgi:hypothetical protein